MFVSNRSGESEVADLWLGIHGEEDVGGFDIAVEDACLVGVSETAADAGDEAGCFLLFDGDSVCGVVEGFAVNELHDDIEHSVDVTEVVDADEVGVIEAGHRFGLGLEAGTELFVGAEFAREDFDGDGAIEGASSGLVDGTHAAGRDEALDLVGGKEGDEFLGGGRNESLVLLSLVHGSRGRHFTCLK